MFGKSTEAPRYRWTFTIDGERRSLYQGTGDSEHLLGNVFTMWLQDRGDVSEWENAALLGAIVHTYSDLSLSVVAVWLGIDPAVIRAVNVPDPGPPWEFAGPEDGVLSIDREIEWIGSGKSG